MTYLPSGTVTSLVTDIKVSTKLTRRYPDAMSRLMARHHEILEKVARFHDWIAPSPPIWPQMNLPTLMLKEAQ